MRSRCVQNRASETPADASDDPPAGAGGNPASVARGGSTGVRGPPPAPPASLPSAGAPRDPLAPGPKPQELDGIVRDGVTDGCTAATGP